MSLCRRSENLLLAHPSASIGLAEFSDVEFFLRHEDLFHESNASTMFGQAANRGLALSGCRHVNLD
jgi:hypothetical protein